MWIVDEYEPPKKVAQESLILHIELKIGPDMVRLQGYSQAPYASQAPPRVSGALRKSRKHRATLNK